MTLLTQSHLLEQHDTIVIHISIKYRVRIPSKSNPFKKLWFFIKNICLLNPNFLQFSAQIATCELQLSCDSCWFSAILIMIHPSMTDLNELNWWSIYYMILYHWHTLNILHDVKVKKSHFIDLDIIKKTLIFIPISHFYHHCGETRESTNFRWLIQSRIPTWDRQ
jgi:hypothetical protein